MSEYPFLALEGTDGAGKTSLRKVAFQALKRQGRELLTTTPFSWRDMEAAETIVMAKAHAVPTPEALITRAYVRDKEVLSDRIIRPQLRFRPVLSDRFLASDLVYHQVLWHIPPAETYRAFCSSRVRMPDVIVFVDTPPEIAFERLEKRGTGGKNRWDYLDKQKRLYELFCEVLFSGNFPALGKVVRIDNSGEKEETARAFLDALSPILGVSPLHPEP